MRTETKARIALIKGLIKQGYSNPEIAKKIGCTRHIVASLAAKHLGGNANYLRLKTKHKHLREDVLIFFLDHTFEETMKQFNLTTSELKSLFTVAYRESKWKHLRKDTRRKDLWTPEQIRKMLCYSGILSRKEIASIIKRDNDRVIKEKMNSLGVSTRNINGLNKSAFVRMTGFQPRYQIKGSAGPRVGETNFIIVPWSYVVNCAVELKMSPTLIKAFKTYAMFQSYVWRGNPWLKMRRDKNISHMLHLEP